MRNVTLCLLTEADRILLGMKKIGFGKGRWNGFGGKVEPGEEIIHAAIRETYEESGLVPYNLSKVADLEFYFVNAPKEKDWNQRVHVYHSNDWVGRLRESDEMFPSWFKFSEIPYANMWQDDQYWLPLILQGRRVMGEFVFGEDNSSIKTKRLLDIEKIRNSDNS